MYIKILGAHNTENSTVRCVSILIDNKIALDAGGLTSGLSPEAQHEIQAVLLTHAHYDHVRDIPNLAMNFYTHIQLFHDTEQLVVYATEQVRETVMEHLFDGKLYPDFTQRPLQNPAARFEIVEPEKKTIVSGHTVLPIIVSHGKHSVGYFITDSSGTSVFYTGDTGQGLSDSWGKIGKPQAIIIEVTLNNEHELEAEEHDHLTPNFLRTELSIFRDIKGYLPRIFVVHMTPELEDDIRSEVATIARELNAIIEICYEGMGIDL